MHAKRIPPAPRENNKISINAKVRAPERYYWQIIFTGILRGGLQAENLKILKTVSLSMEWVAISAGLAKMNANVELQYTFFPKTGGIVILFSCPPANFSKSGCKHTAVNEVQKKTKFSKSPLHRWQHLGCHLN